MEFDPDNVKRTTLRRDMVRDTSPFDPGDEVVHASDFDQLLASYRAKEARLLELAILFGVPDGGRYIEDWRAKRERLAAAIALKP